MSLSSSYVIVQLLFLLVLVGWIVYSYLSSTTKAPVMTYGEFLMKLRSLPVEWKTIRVMGGDYSIVSVSPPGLSPLTAVYKEITGSFIPVHACSSAVNFLGLPPDVARNIVFAEVGRLDDSRYNLNDLERVRHDLLSVTRLE